MLLVAQTIYVVASMAEVDHLPAFSVNVSMREDLRLWTNGVMLKNHTDNSTFLLITIGPTIIPTVGNYCDDA
jgi:hypothetical protein